MTQTCDQTRTSSPGRKRTKRLLSHVDPRVRGKRIPLRLGVCLLCGKSVQSTSDARAKRAFCSAEHEQWFCMQAMNRSWTYSS